MAGPETSFRGRMALVTGGASGTDEAVCRILAAEGATLVVAEKQADDLAQLPNPFQGTFLVTRAASRNILGSGIPLPKDGATIVNIASIAAKACAPGLSAYAASKAGVVALPKTAAKEVAPQGIRCNAVLPGWNDTPMSAGVDQKRKHDCPSRRPLKRAAQPQEIAEAVKFLCCSTASSYVIGAALEVTEGLHMRISFAEWMPQHVTP